MDNKILISKYLIFALVATFVNLMTQRILLIFIKLDLSLFIAIACGTLSGLIVKYYLDKKWIFKYKCNPVETNNHMFMKYSLFGIFTTTIFWISETMFWVIFQNHLMRELGAVIGLAIGYVVKYNIDKKYVFKTIN